MGEQYDGYDFGEAIDRLGKEFREKGNLMGSRTEHTARSYEAHRTEVYEEHARKIHEKEQECRNRPRIQPSEIDYVKKAAEAPDVDTFLRLV